MALHKHQMERTLRMSEQWVATTLTSISNAVMAADHQGCLTLMNPVAEALTGWRQEEAAGKPVAEVFQIGNDTTQIPSRSPVRQALAEGVPVRLANQILIAKDGTEKVVDVSAVPVKDDKENIAGVVLIVQDITERKRGEQMREALYRASLVIQEPHNLEERVNRLLTTAQTVLELDRVKVLLADPEGQWLQAVASIGTTEPLETIRVPIGPEGGAIAQAYLTRQTIVWDGRESVPQALRFSPPYDQIEALRSRVFANLPLVAEGRVIGILGADRIQSRRPLDPATVELLQLFAAQAAIAIASARLFEEMEATNRRRLALNQVAQTVNQSLNLQEVLDAALDATLNAVEVEGGNIRLWDEPQGVLAVAAFRGMSEWYIDQRRNFKPGEGVAGKVFERGETFLVEDMEQYPHLNEMAQRDGVRSVASVPIRSRDKMVGVMSILSHGQRRFTPPEIDLLTAIGNQIGTAIENARLFESIAQGKLELERSNQELEQFAYVASHDLQEPLRMVSNYIRLLARRYKGRFDADADEFIDYAVDGAKRMQTLIQDLLAYSRVGTRGREFEPTDCEGIFGQAVANLQMSVEECGAVVTHDPLPTVRGDGTQLSQLFQNLIGNAIKFRSEKPPAVHVGATRQAGAWLFSVRDNGISIDLGHAERIFLIFQRLHHKTEYPGTGIGLAICKRIVERHGGRIWMQSEPGEGTTFYFTIPDRQ